MAVDMIARAMALDAAAGGGVDPGEGYTKEQVDTLLSGKVDKVSGKGLSTEDYTTAEKTKLSRIEAGAEANVQSDWAQTDTDADDYIKNKPTLGAAAAKGVDSAPTASSTNLVESGGVEAALAGKQATLTAAQQAAADSGITAEKIATIDTSLAGKVDKVDGKSLSTEDYTTAEKSKLSGIAAGAEVNVQPDWSQADSTADDFIKNKPTIPAAQVNADWNASSGAAQILNKPTLGTAAALNMDTALSGSSVNPVQNKAVKAETDKLGAGLAEAINAGAKNVLLIKNYTAGQTFTNGGRTFTFQADGGVKITGSATGTGTTADCYLVGSWTGTSTVLGLGGKNHTVVLKSSASLANVQLCVYNRSTGSNVNSVRVGTNDTDGEVINFDATAIFLSINSSVTLPTDGIVVYPMICPKALFDASPDFAQYAPTNRELYEMILALQAGT